MPGSQPPASHFAGHVAPKERQSQELHRANSQDKKRRLLEILWDGEWHSAGELNRLLGWRFGAAFRQLRVDGWKWESEQIENAGGVCRYRLLSHEKGEPVRTKVRLYAYYEDVEALLYGEVTTEMAKAADVALCNTQADKPTGSKS